MKKKLLSIFFLIVVLSQSFAGIMEKPRKVYAFSTEYFDILFPEDSLKTAQIIAGNADQLYNQAVSGLDSTSLKSRMNKKFPVIISPDSDQFSVTYTPVPYNRIVIYEAVPSINDSHFTDILLSSFYSELIRAVYQSYLGPKETVISKFITTDSFQPVYLENMPFSFLEGIQFLKEGDELSALNNGSSDSDTSSSFHESAYIRKNPQGQMNDGYFLQILSQAKLEDKFPDFIQTLGSQDVYPGSEIIQAAGAGFCAYILQRWGSQKFSQLWKNAGSFTLYLTEGIFKKVYGLSITDAWKDFENSVPLPVDLENLNKLEKQSALLFQYENKGLYKELINSPYGLIWYDDIRHEVALCNQDSLYKGRQLLFIADNVTRLSLSPDGRFLITSFQAGTLHEELPKNQIWIYDLKNRVLTGENLNLRDAFIVILKDGTYCIAGIANNKTYSSIQIYSSAELNKQIYKIKSKNNSYKTKLLYEKKFASDSIPFTPISVSSEKMYAVLNSRNDFYLYSWNFKSDEELFYALPEGTKIRNLNLNQNPYNTQNFSSSILTYEYVQPESPDINFTRFGFSFLNENNEPEQTWFLKNNLSGGANYPIIKGNDLFYAAKKYDHGEIRSINLQKLQFVNTSITQVELSTSYDDEIFDAVNQSYNIAKNSLFNYEQKPYKQITDVFKGTVYPFAPVKEISVVDKAERAAGIGVTFSSLADKYSSNLIVLSAGIGFLDLSFDKYLNPNDKILEEIEKEYLEKYRDHSAAFFYSNTATPVDISVGSLYKATKYGDYNLKSLIGTTWTLPLGMAFRKLNFNMELDYNASTRFRDSIYSDLYPSKPGKTKLKDSYQDFEFSYTIEYTNLHKSGFSPYEQRGFSAAISTNIIWDYNLPMLEPTDSTDLFRVKDFATNTFTAPSQINLGLSGQAKIPQLSFIKDYNNWILCFPSALEFELFKTNGTAFEVKTETLIFGREIQNGFNFLHLYFSRIGLKAGYDYSLIYDTDKVSAPDVRDFSRFYYAFVNTYIQDKLIVSAEVDFVPAIGILSSALMNLDFTYEYYIRSNSSKFSVDFEIKL